MPAPTAPTGNQDDFFAGLSLDGDLGDELLQLRRVDLFPAVGQDTRPELDDKPGGGFERIAMHNGKLKKLRGPENVKIEVISRRDRFYRHGIISGLK